MGYTCHLRLGIICQLTGLNKVDPAIGMYDLIPDKFFLPSIAPIFMKFDFKGAWALE